ncbi:MAG: pseudouridine synthase [Clostridiales bacterium]|nr:pseudouridine synthase [Eubacterium sp.]MDD5993250.1 pseudouridine synthase [Clostridiales bacterium]MDD7349129.1 pseudouridine synthase [Clostridiales bacterium]MDY3774068.1 pseudouridine synthase [Eubacterium sp.]
MTEQLRINKYLSSIGFCSRREADRLLEQGKVKIDGETAQVGQRVMPEQEVTVNGIPVKDKPREIIIAFNKPKGIVCTSSKKEKNNIVDYLHFPTRIYPVGRLDKDSTGLILLTNDGELTDCILRGKNNHEKEYLVTVQKPLRAEIIHAMEQGVPILDTMTRPCRIIQIDSHTFRIILTQGLNRQIRRMCEYFGYKVITLKRVRVMNIHLGDLKEGTWREITGKELAELKDALKGQKFYNE